MVSTNEKEMLSTEYVDTTPTDTESEDTNNNEFDKLKMKKKKKKKDISLKQKKTNKGSSTTTANINTGVRRVEAPKRITKKVKVSKEQNKETKVIRYYNSIDILLFILNSQLNFKIFVCLYIFLCSCNIFMF